MKEASAAIISPALEEVFLSGWKQCRILFFSAPCGCGKTTVARALLAGKRICFFDAGDASRALPEIPGTCEALLVDNLQSLREAELQEALCALLRSRPSLHFIFLSRGKAPGWLMPFQFSGLLLPIETDLLLLDRASSRRMLSSRGIEVSEESLSAIQRDMRGYPAAMSILCRRLSGGGVYGPGVLHAVRQELFVCYDELVFRQFDPSVRKLLLDVAPFPEFSLELARMTSGNNRAGELLGQLLRDTSILLLNETEGAYRFYPIFRDFLLWEEQQKYSDGEQRALYARAALYYELHGRIADALECYSRSGDQRRVSELLEKNAELHPGAGHYYEMERYYFALPREEILRSPALMCGMSMLTSLGLDFEASEAWYRDLQSYAANLKKTDAEFRDVQGKLAYLDIALPQRGSRGLIEIIGSVFRILTDRQICLPAFSVTSTLPSIMNGGKDFCEWSKKDELLYATMRRPVETILGRDGVGLADCAICESKFEKGEDVSRLMLTLLSRLGEIQAKGTPDIEFAVVGLLARIQVAQGNAGAALDAVQNLRDRYVQTEEERFLPNMDAMLCRIRLRTGDTEGAVRWLQEQAPRNGERLRALWRYRYLTRAMVQLAVGEPDEALLALVPLLPYCEHCGRVMDALHIRILMALCHYQQGNETWQQEFSQALDTCRGYAFIQPVAQYGAAVLPLLRECGWNADAAMMGKILAATRAQAVNYPDFLRQRAELAEPLTAMETQVLRLVCHNLSNSEIGEMLGIGLATVKTHVSHILQKLGVSRRSEAGEAARKLGLL